jgi:helicase
MKIYDAGWSTAAAEDAVANQALDLSSAWGSILAALTRGRSLRPVQRLAVEEAQLLESRQHVVVCAPTNSGKTVVGYMVLIEALLRNQNALLIEPLRALAQEKSDELEVLLSDLSPEVFPAAPKVRLTTGDYRLESESADSPPPEGGQLIVATPERFEGILRNPANSAWIAQIGAVVIDEAHLIKDPKRGPTLELLIASLISLPAPPRVALLSATVGNPERLKEWLTPCQLIRSTARTPLKKEVWALSAGEQVEETLASSIRQILEDPDSSVLVFVYRKSSADALARQLTDALRAPVPSYHSGQSASDKASRRDAFNSGSCRCVVSTTALAMGVNLPATHVIVRDTTFFGVGKLPVDQLLQILGRAGRGDRAGTGIVLVRPEDDWDASELAQSLAEERIEPIRSSFEQAPLTSAGAPSRDRGSNDSAVASVVASCLSRTAADGISKASLRTVLDNTLAGQPLASRIEEAVRWLSATERHLAYMDDQDLVHLTVLGRAGIQSMLPLEVVAGIGQLVRDLLSLDPTGKLLKRWSCVDHLLIVSLLSDRTPKMRRFSEALAGQLDAWHEALPNTDKSLLFAEWIARSASTSKAGELFGSLGIVAGQKQKQADSARNKAYTCMLSAAVMHQRANGVSITDLESRWSISGLAGIEENWRDTMLWLISGLNNLFEIRAFYHHLRENCEADVDQIKDVKRYLRDIRYQGYELMERIKHCSPLGGLLRGLQALYADRDGQTAGIGTIRKLESAGIESIRQVASLSVGDLVQIGVQRRFALQIRRYVERKLR